MDPKLVTLQNVLNVFVKNYQSNPIKYFYEEDLRAHLLYLLITEEIFNIKLPITDENEWLRDYVGILDKEINISGIKAEYPSTTKFDIAYINNNSIIPDNYFNHYIFGCLFAIEIKLGQKDNKNSDFKSDIMKLCDYKKEHHDFTGIAINFEQNPRVEKDSLFKDYNNHETLKIEELTEGIELIPESINCFFICPKFTLGGLIINT